jgi:hypothetical protein
MTSRSQNVVFARAMGWAWPLQLVVVAIWLEVPHPPDAHVLVLGAITVGFCPLYLPLLLKRNPVLTRRGTNIAMTFGVIQMATMIWAGGGLASGFELMPLWFVPMTVCLLPRLDVLIELLVVIVAAVVAEGVETEEQLARIGELGCESAQGYLFARPAEAGAAHELPAGEPGLITDAA